MISYLSAGLFYITSKVTVSLLDEVILMFLLCFLCQEIVLGIASLSALGPFGAAVEITVILYPCFTLRSFIIIAYHQCFMTSNISNVR